MMLESEATGLSLQVLQGLDAGTLKPNLAVD